MIIGSVTVAIGLLILGWTKELVSFFIKDKKKVGMVNAR